MNKLSAVHFVLSTTILCFLAPDLQSQDCTDPTQIQNFSGGGQVACPCFIQGEEAGSIFVADASHYPLEITKIGIGWGSQFGGAPQTLEQAIHLYAGTLPDPGVPIFSLNGPQMTDGFINEFDIEALPGNKVIFSGPFTITLEFFNQNANDVFAPSMVHDGNGCQAGKNVVKAIPGGWADACALGVTGDWVVTATYRCLTTSDTHTISNRPGVLSAHPNPFHSEAQISFNLPRAEHARVAIYDVLGRHITTLTNEMRAPGRHTVFWLGTNHQGQRVSSGTYFAKLLAGRTTSTQKLILND